MILLIILQLLVAPFEDYPQIQPDGVIVQNQTDKIPATAHERWVYCNQCGKHLPEVNGIIYDWINQGIGQEHIHQSGWTEEQPIDSHNTGIYFLLVLAAIYCFYLMTKPIKE